MYIYTYTCIIYIYIYIIYTCVSAQAALINCHFKWRCVVCP